MFNPSGRASLYRLCILQSDQSGNWKYSAFYDIGFRAAAPGKSVETGKRVRNIDVTKNIDVRGLMRSLGPRSVDGTRPPGSWSENSKHDWWVDPAAT